MVSNGAVFNYIDNVRKMGGKTVETLPSLLENPKIIPELTESSFHIHKTRYQEFLEQSKVLVRIEGKNIYLANPPYDHPTRTKHYSTVGDALRMLTRRDTGEYKSQSSSSILGLSNAESKPEPVPKIMPKQRELASIIQESDGVKVELRNTDRLDIRQYHLEFIELLRPFSQ